MFKGRFYAGPEKTENPQFLSEFFISAWEFFHAPSLSSFNKNKVSGLYDWILYVPVNNLSVTSGRVFLGQTSTKLGLMCLALGHNALTRVRLEPAALLVSSQALYHWATVLPIKWGYRKCHLVSLDNSEYV